MTLVLTLLLPHVVVQASDRRVTYLKGKRITSVDDERNKAILYCDRVAFSYTGPAAINGIPTDEWIARRLAEAGSLEEGFVNLRAAATKAYQGNLSLRAWPLRIVAGGWRYMGPEGLGAFAADVRNTDGVSQRVQERFTWNYEKPPTPRSMGLFAVGRALPLRERAALTRALVSAGNRRIHVTNAMRLLVDAIRQRARMDPFVGQNVMVFCIPRSAVGPPGPTGLPERPIVVWEGRVDPTGPSFALYPAGSTDIQAVVPTLVYGDTVVADGIAKRASQW